MSRQVHVRVPTLCKFMLAALLQVSPGCFEVKDGPEQLNSLSRWLPTHTNLVTSLVIEDSRFAAATENRDVWEAGLVCVL